jgi:hypothetical protein
MGEILDANHMFDTNNDRRQHGYFQFEMKVGCHAGRGSVILAPGQASVISFQDLGDLHDECHRSIN